MKFMFNRKGNIAVMEFLIIAIILTFFIFFPFAVFSAYQQRNILEDIKDRTLQLVSVSGSPNTAIFDTITKEFEFYNLKPKTGQRIIVSFYNVSQDANQFNDPSLTTGKKTVLQITNNSGKLTYTVLLNAMTPAYRERNDIIRVAIQYPADDLLNSVLSLIGRQLTNTNDTNAKFAYKVSGYAMSEYVP